MTARRLHSVRSDRAGNGKGPTIRDLVPEADRWPTKRPRQWLKVGPLRQAAMDAEAMAERGVEGAEKTAEMFREAVREQLIARAFVVAARRDLINVTERWVDAPYGELLPHIHHDMETAYAVGEIYSILEEGDLSWQEAHDVLDPNSRQSRLEGLAYNSDTVKQLLTVAKATAEHLGFDERGFTMNPAFMYHPAMQSEQPADHGLA